MINVVMLHDGVNERGYRLARRSVHRVSDEHAEVLITAGDAVRVEDEPAALPPPRDSDNVSGAERERYRVTQSHAKAVADAEALRAREEREEREKRAAMKAAQKALTSSLSVAVVVARPNMPAFMGGVEPDAPPHPETMGVATSRRKRAR